MATVTLHLDKGQQMQHKKNRLALYTIEGITSAMTAIILSTAWPPKASDFMLKNHKAFASAHSCIPQRIERFQEMLSKGAEKRFLKLAKEKTKVVIFLLKATDSMLLTETETGHPLWSQQEIDSVRSSGMGFLLSDGRWDSASHLRENDLVREQLSKVIVVFFHEAIFPGK